MKLENMIAAACIVAFLGACVLFLVQKAVRSWIQYRKQLAGSLSKLLWANIVIWLLPWANPSIYTQTPEICLYIFCGIYLTLIICLHTINMLVTYRATGFTVPRRWQFQNVLFHMSILGIFSSLPLAIGNQPTANTAGRFAMATVAIAGVVNGLCYVLGGMQGQELWLEDMRAQGKKLEGHIVPMSGGYFTVED